jgi:outer membrane protein insertion porin family
MVYTITRASRSRSADPAARQRRTQDKVILRDLRLSPGDVYDSGKVQDATERLRGLPTFQNVRITAGGRGTETRDLLVEVEEARTATLTFGAGVNSNGGVAGNITYTQKNFDITNWPRSIGDLRSDRSFIGAGQTLRLSFEPGSENTNASISFTEPWVFDQPYSFTTEAFLRTRRRENYDDDRYGGRVIVGKRFNEIYSASIGLRASRSTSATSRTAPCGRSRSSTRKGSTRSRASPLSARRDTTVGGLLPGPRDEHERGVGERRRARRRVLVPEVHRQPRPVLHAVRGPDRPPHDPRAARRRGYIAGGAPFFERFYAGGINSVRGFAFRGITPRDGPDDDRIGGDFTSPRRRN